MLGVQPRIRLMRSFDQRSHTYQGYVLGLRGTVDDEEREFIVALGEAAQAEHQIAAGDRVMGAGVRVADPRTEIAELYKVSALRVFERRASPSSVAPPWSHVTPTLEVYGERGPRRLDARTYDTKCATCTWGARMAVELVIDQWDRNRAPRYRVESFCYGPLSCRLYKAGATRKVPGRNGMSWEEEDWIDEDTVRHRGPDE